MGGSPAFKEHRHQLCAAQIGAEDGDGVGLRLRYPADTGLKRCFIHLGESEIVRKAEVALGHHLDTDAGIGGDDPLLHLGQGLWCKNELLWHFVTAG
jgi:hypothetical protein